MDIGLHAGSENLDANVTSVALGNQRKYQNFSQRESKSLQVKTPKTVV
jgi:hypothetical protein